MKGIIDRFEGDYAVVEFENKIMKDIEKKHLPSEAKEGDVIIFTGQKYIIDIKETIDRKNEIKKLTENLWE